MSQRIAVVGAGISGLVSAHVLSREHDVTVYEAADRIGGHTNTIEVERADGTTLPVDTGFIVFHKPNYPGFTRLLEQLEVESQPSDMSFSVKCERTGLEYRGSGLNTFFAQRSNLVKPRMWRMLRDILRFNHEAPALLAEASHDLTLGDFLDEQGYGRAFREHYIVPMGAAVWSAHPDAILAFSARAFVAFFDHHAFLKLRGRPSWQTVRGGSRTYLDRLLARFAGRVRTSAPVQALRRRDGGGVDIRAEGEAWEPYDAAVLAVHGDVAYRMLLDASPAEHEVMGTFRTQENDTVLHTDASLMPRTRRAWSSWNYHAPAEPAGGAAVTYHMNRLQSLDEPVDYFVTLNRSDAIDPDSIIRRIAYRHPSYTPATHRAQVRWAEVSGVRDTHYCGAYWGNGFHEDGVQSALRVCRAFGLELS